MKPTLQDIFGEGTTQTIDNLIIPKANLVPEGLEALANNEGSDLFIAILKKVARKINPTLRDSDFDVLIAVDLGEDDLPSYTTRTVGSETKTYERITVSVELDELYTRKPIRPMIY